MAVSGGVDSMALLHLLSHRNHHKNTKLIVAHFDHGIRKGSDKDRQLVQEVAREYKLPFAYKEVKLGPGASEAEARQKRYEFLHEVRRASHSDAVVTAHHQDDLLETVILNLRRGTGRKGLTSLSDRPDVRRPLLHVPKQDLINYALANELLWREDSTNADEKYTRNYVRHHIMPKLDTKSRNELLDIIQKAHELNNIIDSRLLNILHAQEVSGRILRSNFVKLSHAEAKELLATWFRLSGITDFDSKTLDRVAVAAKTAHPGAKIDIINGRTMTLNEGNLAL